MARRKQYADLRLGVTGGVAERVLRCGEPLGVGSRAHAQVRCVRAGESAGALQLVPAVGTVDCGEGAQRGAAVRRSLKPASPRGGRSTRRLSHGRSSPSSQVGALLAILLYVELARDHAPVAASAAPAPPAGMPALQAPPVTDLGPLEAAVAAAPDDADALLRLANALHDNGMYLRAVETYKKYLRLQPRNPDARVDMGVCYYELGLTDTINQGRYFSLAIEEMEAAFRSAPSHQPSVFNLGVVHLQKGDLETSNRWFRKAVELNATSDLGAKAKQLLERHSFNP